MNGHLPFLLRSHFSFFDLIVLTMISWLFHAGSYLGALVLLIVGAACSLFLDIYYWKPPVMKYFYYDPMYVVDDKLGAAFVLDEAREDCGELLGTTQTPPGVPDPDARFILSALLHNAGYDDVDSLTIFHTPPEKS